MHDNDLSRMLSEYSERSRRLAGSDIYSLFNLPNLFIIQQRERRILQILHRHGLNDLNNELILEMGCGKGGVLLDFIRLGANLHKLTGIDLNYDRLREGYAKLPLSLFVNANGLYLPFPDKQYNFLLQFTAFSSILDKDIKRNLASEMLRVLRPGGFILWYDFWLNPSNPQTYGIKPQEIRKLFPNCWMEFHKITLAPPIVRCVVPLSWILALFLESLKIFNSHYLVLIKKSNS